jgi:hypothetical protein
VPVVSNETCYMCDSPKTSGEHVPPKCLFPEQKDCEDGKDYRKNLIKVPSCDLHNLAKSKDDEYMLITFATYANVNLAGINHQKNKLLRILEKKSHVFIDLLKNSTPATYVDKEGVKHETCVFNLDKERFFKQLQQVANGVYFHYLNKKVTKHTEVVPIKGFATNNYQVNKSNSIIAKQLPILFKEKPKYGENPDVFYYQVSSNEEEPMIKLVFYSGIEFIAAFNIDK